MTDSDRLRVRLAEATRSIDEWEPDVVAAGIIAGDLSPVTHGPTDRILPVASLTKPMTAWGVLLAAERGLLHLDEPVDIDGGHESDLDVVTVRHLLAHAGGLPLETGGRRRPPAQRRVYSNWGYDLLGTLVEQRAGQPFAGFLDDELFAPLGMTATALNGSPARAATSSVDDILRFAAELRRPQLLSAELHLEATKPVFAQLDGILPGFGRQQPNLWGLGVEIRGDKQPHWAGRSIAASAFGHFGQSGSLLIVDPTRDVAVVSLSDRAFGKWAAKRWPTFIDAAIDIVDGQRR